MSIRVVGPERVKVEQIGYKTQVYTMDELAKILDGDIGNWSRRAVLNDAFMLLIRTRRTNRELRYRSIARQLEDR